MALINCPECKNKVSDSAVSCPHCGFPISKRHSSIPERVKFCYQCKSFYTVNELICPKCRSVLATRTREEARKFVANSLRCPTCHSFNVEKISVVDKAFGAATLGLLSKTAKSQFRCKNCGYKW